MIGKKSSKSKKVASTNDADFAVLDDAVSELAKQTEALLGKSGEKMSKPKLPKKSIHQHKAKSFDIIHNPGAQKRTASVLKSAQPTQKLLEPSDEKLIETATNSDAPEENTQSEESTTQVVAAHTSGSLNLSKDEADTPGVTTLESDDMQKNQPIAVQNKQSVIQPSSTVDNTDDTDKAESSASSDIEPALDSSNDSIDLHEDDASATALVDELDTDKSGEETKTKPLEEMPKKDEKVDEPEAKSVEIYSENLKSDPVTFDEDADEPKVAVFDTEEYHSTLHDWSKLERHSKAPIVLLLILSILLAAGVYVIVSGVSVPKPF